MTAVNVTWRALLQEIITFGGEVRAQVSAGAAGRTTKELIGKTTLVNMNQSVVTVPVRKLGYRFLAAEAAWILSGDNRVSTIAPYARHIKDYSDDGFSFFGAYGVKFREQASYVVDRLWKDQTTRQAVMTIWRERPGDTKDPPCTVALQWLIRAGQLHCVATMRSSDAWLGWVYDVHSFSMMSAYVLLMLRARSPQREWCQETVLGNLHLTAGSQHLYSLDWPISIEAVRDEGALFEYRPFNSGEFTDPDDLTEHLWRLANAQPVNRNRAWLLESRPAI